MFTEATYIARYTAPAPTTATEEEAMAPAYRRLIERMARARAECPEPGGQPEENHSSEALDMG